MVQASRVCRNWQALCDEQIVWRNLFDNQGWGYDRQEIDAYLLNAPEKGDDITRNIADDLVTTSSGLSSIAINRTSAPFIIENKSSRLYITRIKRQLPKTVHQDELIEYHYDPISDTRFINWQRLYRNRYAIEKRWICGAWKLREFPPRTCPRSDLHATEGIYCIQFDKEKYVTGSRDKTIKIWDVSGKCMQTVTGHTGSVLCLQYDGTTIVSGSSDSNLMISDLVSGIVKRTLKGHLDSVLCLRIVGKDRVISCSKDRSLRLWNINTGECIRIYNGHSAAVNAVHWKDDKIVSGSGDRTIRIWDLESGKCLKKLNAHSRGVACIEYDGKRIISGSSDLTIKVWNAETGDCIYTLAGHSNLVRAIQMDNVANRIISGCYNGLLKIWSLDEGRLIQDLGKATGGR